MASEKAPLPKTLPRVYLASKVCGMSGFLAAAAAAAVLVALPGLVGCFDSSLACGAYTVVEGPETHCPNAKHFTYRIRSSRRSTPHDS
jgi:hypothetical protein